MRQLSTNTTHSTDVKSIYQKKKKSDTYIATTFSTAKNNDEKYLLEKHRVYNISNVAIKVLLTLLRPEYFQINQVYVNAVS